MSDGLRLDGRVIEAILLDLDDTILDERPGRAAGNAAGIASILESHPGLDHSTLAERLDRCSREFWSDPRLALPGRLDMRASRIRIHEALLESVGISDPGLARRSADAYWVARDAALAPFPGAVDALASLRGAARRMALVTNGAGASQRAKIERFDLARYFDHLQIEGEFGLGKPEGAVFRNALDRIGAEPETSLMAGDNFEIDIVGAIDAGLAAVWIDKNGEGAPPRGAPRPHGILLTIATLPDLLKNGSGG